ncbi:MAG: amidohydrolase family protein [Planctomycetota bacterium]
MVIDSHHHLWKYTPAQYGWITEDKAVLKRDFWLKDLSELASANGVDGFVTVQARQSLLETDTLLGLAEELPLIRGVVGWVDFRSPEIEAQLEKYADASKLKGLRHVVHDEPDDDFILGNAFNRGIAKLNGSGFVYDVLIFAKHLQPSIEFVRKHPDIPMVIDHIAKPTIRANQFDDEWAAGIREIAHFTNVTCKVSGVATEVRDEAWSIDTVRPYWDTVLASFGPSRLMYGSDWPVCLLKTQYGRWLSTVKELASELSDDEQRDLFGGTAQRVYDLEQD